MNPFSFVSENAFIVSEQIYRPIVFKDSLCEETLNKKKCLSDLLKSCHKTGAINQAGVVFSVESDSSFFSCSNFVFKNGSTAGRNPSRGL